MSSHEHNNYVYGDKQVDSYVARTMCWGRQTADKHNEQMRVARDVAHSGSKLALDMEGDEKPNHNKLGPYMTRVVGPASEWGEGIMDMYKHTNK
jgi:hypothetical protein